MSARVNTALFDLLKSSDTAALIALNLALPGQGIYHMQLPQINDELKLPGISYFRIDSEPQIHLLGDCGLVFAEYQFNIYGRNAFDHSQIADLFKKAIHAWLDKTVSGVNFRSIFVLGDNETYNVSQVSSEQGEYRTAIRCSVKYRDTIVIQPTS